MNPKIPEYSSLLECGSNSCEISHLLQQILPVLVMLYLSSSSATATDDYKLSTVTPFQEPKHGSTRSKTTGVPFTISHASADLQFQNIQCLCICKHPYWHTIPPWLAFYVHCKWASFPVNSQFFVHSEITAWWIIFSTFEQSGQKWNELPPNCSVLHLYNYVSFQYPQILWIKRLVCTAPWHCCPPHPQKKSCAKSLLLVHISSECCIFPLFNQFLHYQGSKLEWKSMCWLLGYGSM